MIPSLLPREVNNKLKIYNHKTISESKTILSMIPYLPADYTPEDFINDLVVAFIYTGFNALTPNRWDAHEGLELRQLFMWKDTPQGFNFWSILNAEIEHNIINHIVK